MSYAKLGMAALGGVAAAYGLTGGRAQGRRMRLGVPALNPIQDAVFKAVKQAAPADTKWRVVRGQQHPIISYEGWDDELVPVRDETRWEPSSTRGLQVITDDWSKGDTILRRLSGAYEEPGDVATPALIQAMEKRGWRLRQKRWSGHISASALERDRVTGKGKKGLPYFQVVGPGHLIEFEWQSPPPADYRETTVIGIGVGPWRSMHDDWSESSVIAPGQSKAYPILFVEWWGNDLRNYR